MEEKKPRRAPSGSTGTPIHARSLGSALQRDKERSYENRERKSESEKETGGKKRGEGAHLHAELQSDCGAHRQLTRFVPSFLNRRH